MQVGRVGELIDDHRASVAADLLIRSEHEVVDEELPAALEEVEKRGISVRSLEPVGLLDQRHRLAAALRGEGVALPRQRLLLREDPFVRCLPLLLWHHVREIHPSLLSKPLSPLIQRVYRTRKS